MVIAAAGGLAVAGGASADPTGPNLNGLWQWYAGSLKINLQFEIGSGTSTQVRGFVDSADGASRNSVINRGSIVGGQGSLAAYDSRASTTAM